MKVISPQTRYILAVIFVIIAGMFGGIAGYNINEERMLLAFGIPALAFFIVGFGLFFFTYLGNENNGVRDHRSSECQSPWSN